MVATLAVIASPLTAQAAARLAHSTGHSALTTAPRAPSSPAALSVPQQPLVTNVTPEGLGVLVSWAPNTSTDAVTSYVVKAMVAAGFSGSVTSKCKSPRAVTVGGADSSALVGALCAAIPYSITVTARNTAGTGPASTPSNPVVPLVAQPPSAPLLTSVYPRSASVLVSWSAPVLLGGDVLTGYTLTARSGAQVVTKSIAASSTTFAVTGLTNGHAYAVSLVAHTAAGTSSPGTASGTPSSRGLPTTPVGLEVVPDGKGHLVAKWSAPADVGTSAISAFVVTIQTETEKSGVWSATGKPVTHTVIAKTTQLTLSGLSAASFSRTYRWRSGRPSGPAQRR